MHFLDFSMVLLNTYTCITEINPTISGAHEKKKSTQNKTEKNVRVKGTGTRPVKIADDPCQLLKNYLWDQFLCSSLIIVLVYVSFFSPSFLLLFSFCFDVENSHSCNAKIIVPTFIQKFMHSEATFFMHIHYTCKYILTHVSTCMHQHMQTIYCL